MTLLIKVAISPTPGKNLSVGALFISYKDEADVPIKIILSLKSNSFKVFCSIASITSNKEYVLKPPTLPFCDSYQFKIAKPSLSSGILILFNNRLLFLSIL